MHQLSILFFPFFIILLLDSLRPAAGHCYTTIFSFGDSIADTGNFLATGASHPSTHLPYGQTYFDHATGRCSDGRLIIDFIAQMAGLPLVPPYLEGSGEHRDFKKGVNFAVLGATALKPNFFWEKGIAVPFTNYSLSTQLEWFNQLLPSLCSSTTECDNMFGNAVIFMGEIGGNDYNNPFFQGRSIEEIRTFVPLVINAISSAITGLIELGARTLLVPGNFPIGCIPAYLSIFRNSTAQDYYDQETGCIKWLNQFSQFHNQLLINELEFLRQLHPYVTIIYADYYEATMTVFRSPAKYGFENPLVACCGGEGDYKYNSSCKCGELGSMVCKDPSRYVSWDGLHFTEAAYKIIADGILHINQTCFLGRNFEDLEFAVI